MVILPPRTSLGDVIGRGLSDLATAYGEHQTSLKALKGLGFNDAQARAYASLGPKIQENAIAARQQEQQQQAANAAISQILGTGLGAAQPGVQQAPAQQATPYQPMPKPQLPHEQQQAAIQQATSIAQNPNFRKLNEQQQQAQALQQKQLTQGPAPAAPRATPEQQAILQAQAQETQKGEPTVKQQLEQVRNQKRALSAANLPPNQAIALHQQLENKEKELRKEAREDRREAREERKESNRSQREVDKETLETYSKTVDAYKAARESNATLGRMQKLIDKGELPHAATVSAVNFLRDGIKLGKFGSIVSLDISALLGGDAQEFDKLSRGMLRNGKEIFGSRMTDFDVDTFLKMIPSLAQTNEGKQRIINTLRAWNDASLLRYDSMKEIIKENGNKRPAHLDILIEDRIGSKLDSLYGQFVEGYGPQNPPATRSLLGDAASAVSQLVFPR